MVEAATPDSLVQRQKSDPFDQAGEEALAALTRPSRTVAPKSELPINSHGSSERLNGLLSTGKSKELRSPARDSASLGSRRSTGESEGEGHSRRRKRKRLLVVYGPLGGARAELVKRVTGDFPHVFRCPVMVCTGTDEDVKQYGTGHPCELISEEKFQEHVALQSLLVFFSVNTSEELGMECTTSSQSCLSERSAAIDDIHTLATPGVLRDIKEECLGVTSTDARQCDTSKVGSFPTSDYDSTFVSMIPLSCSTTLPSGEVRDQSSVDNHAADSSGVDNQAMDSSSVDNQAADSHSTEKASATKSDSSVTRQTHVCGEEAAMNGDTAASQRTVVLFGITKAAMLDAMQSSNSSLLLSVDHTAAADLLKQPTNRFAMSFVCLSPTREEARPWRSEHPTITTADSESALTEFSNAALVAMAMLQSEVSPRGERPNTLSQADLQACSEWESVETVELTFSKNKSVVPKQMKEFITFAEALAFFQSQKISTTVAVQVSEQHTGSASDVKLLKSLAHEHQLMLDIVNQPFDNSRPLHQRVLQTIYKKLTGTVINCPRFGSHWQAVGFQGTDPSTDLRSMGFWSLMQLLHFVSTDRLLPLALSIYKLSQEAVQNFPFCTMSINITKLALQILNSGALNKMCNKRDQVIGCVNDVYVGLFFQLFSVWKMEKKTIADSGFVLKDLESYARHHPKRLLQQVEEYLDTMTSGSTLGQSPWSLRKNSRKS